MHRRVRKVLALVAPVVFVVGCSDKKTETPTNLSQPLPKAVGSGGQTPDPGKGTLPESGKGKKASQPGAAAD